MPDQLNPGQARAELDATAYGPALPVQADLAAAAEATAAALNDPEASYDDWLYAADMEDATLAVWQAANGVQPALDIAHSKVIDLTPDLPWLTPGEPEANLEAEL